MGILVFGAANAQATQRMTDFAPTERPAIDREVREAPSALPDDPGGLILQNLNVVILLGDQALYAQTVVDFLLASGHVLTVDVIEIFESTPTLPDIESYDAVIVWTNVPPWDPVALGDLLADYIDLGKGVIACEAAFTASWGLQGRFMAEYSPYTATDVGFVDVSLGTYDPDHPLMEDVSAVTDYFVFDLGLTGNAACVAWWDNDWPFVAYNSANNRVVGINAFPNSDGAWTGDLMQVILNSVLFVTTGQQEVPTLSEWGMIILGLLLLGGGTIAIIRRRKAAVSFDSVRTN